MPLLVLDGLYCNYMGLVEDAEYASDYELRKDPWCICTSFHKNELMRRSGFKSFSNMTTHKKGSRDFNHTVCIHGTWATRQPTQVSIYPVVKRIQDYRNIARRARGDSGHRYATAYLFTNYFVLMRVLFQDMKAVGWYLSNWSQERSSWNEIYFGNIIKPDPIWAQLRTGCIYLESSVSTKPTGFTSYLTRDLEPEKSYGYILNTMPAAVSSRSEQLEISIRLVPVPLLARGG